MSKESQIEENLIRQLTDLKYIYRPLKYTRAFDEAYPQFPIVQVPLARIIWRCHQSIEKWVKENMDLYNNNYFVA